jgi:hypothetical protein
MNFLLGKLKSTFLTEGISKVYIKSFRRVKGIVLQFIYRSHADPKPWSSLKNKYKGQRVFLIGAGPSINKTPLYLLKNENTMVFNRFFYFSERINWDPTFYLTVDDVTFIDTINEINDYIPKAKYAFFPYVHYRGVVFFNKIKNNKNILWLKQVMGKGISNALPKIYPGSSVVIEGFQILQYLGFDEIYVLGVDMSFNLNRKVEYLSSTSIDVVSQNDDDDNHFDPRYCGKGSKFRQPEAQVVENIFADLENIAQISKNNGVAIYNIGFDSMVECFKKIPFDEIFGYEKSTVESLFLECFPPEMRPESVKIFETESQFINNPAEWDINLSSFYTDLSSGVELIKKAIFTHIPLGPYESKYYFVRRM